MDRSKSTARATLVALAVLFNLRCGSDGEEEAPAVVDACAAPGACGGKIAGVWHARATCFAATEAQAGDCPGQRVDTKGVRLEGSMKFQTDMTIEYALAQVGSVASIYPPECLKTADGRKVTCAQVDAATKKLVADGKVKGVASVACAGDMAGACTCTSMLAPETPNPTKGTYTVTGNQVTLLVPGEEPESFSYCVKSGILTIRLGTTDAQGMGGMAAASVAFSQK